MSAENDVINVGGPWFEDLAVGQAIADTPAVTITDGHAALHMAAIGDRMRLPLDHGLSATVTEEPRALVHPMLVANMAIGQTTWASFRVKANLFYRGLVLRQPVFIGDTLSTVTKVVALKQNAPKPGRAATGLVGLEIVTTNQRDETVLRFWRCPMVACRDPNAATGHADSLDAIPAEIADADLRAAVPAHWNLDAFRRLPGLHAADVKRGTRYNIEARDSVSVAPEIARLTLNMAMTHFDAAASIYGTRLIFGGHAIGIASAQIVRALPNIVTLIAWRGCDHLAPVFEGDMLSTRLGVEGVTPLENGGALVDLRAIVTAERGLEAIRVGQSQGAEVLDWRVVALMA
ncbi:MAG TPA: MaoC family dehydratase [Alphaproteobacteria bacterium]|jgi:acyl dehydratase